MSFLGTTADLAAQTGAVAPSPHPAAVAANGQPAVYHYQYPQPPSMVPHGYYGLVNGNHQGGMTYPYRQQPMMPYYSVPTSLNVPVREPTPEPEPIKEEPGPSEEFQVKQEPDDDFDGDIDIQIRNVVCNYLLPLHIDLRRVALNSNNVTFDRGRGVLLQQLRNPNCYVKVYSSGKIYIVGCKSETDSTLAARTVARSIQKIMGKTKDRVAMRNYRVCNVLATCKMPFGIKIEELAQKYPAQSQYEPELSIGLVWRMQDPKATLRIHTTGSVTVTGATSEEAVMRAIEIIYPIVKEFKCMKRGRGETTKTRKRKRAAPAAGAAPKRARAAAPERDSGAVGNRVYFSDEDEDDIYDEEDLVDDDD